MSLYYASTGLGACIVAARSLRQAHADVLRTVGPWNGIKSIQKATPENIAWVRGMGGCIPRDIYTKAGRDQP
jgi:hypothetical protein